jgi:signal recognition particle GTPase
VGDLKEEVSDLQKKINAHEEKEQQQQINQLKKTLKDLKKRVRARAAGPVVAELGVVRPLQVRAQLLAQPHVEKYRHLYIFDRRQQSRLCLVQEVA